MLFRSPELIQRAMQTATGSREVMVAILMIRRDWWCDLVDWEFGYFNYPSNQIFNSKELSYLSAPLLKNETD